MDPKPDRAYRATGSHTGGPPDATGNRCRNLYFHVEGAGVVVGPVFFIEQRISRGREIDLVKSRTINAEALARLNDGPSHIERFERAGMVTRVGE